MHSARKGAWRWLWLLGALSVFALLIAACGDDDDDDNGDGNFRTVTIQAGQTIKIGISAATSGNLAALGGPIVAAGELAGEGVEIEGFALEFVNQDELCTADGGASAATSLVSAGVVAVMGPMCSGAVIAAQPIYEAAGISHVSPSSTAIAATAPAGRDPYGTFFRTTYNDAIQGPVQAEFALETLGAETAYIVFDTDAYGSGLRDSFRTAFEDGGGTIVGNPEGYEKEQTDFQSIVTNIRSANPDLVYFAGFYAEATTFIQQLRAQMPDVLFLTGDGVRSVEFITGAGAAAEGAYLSLPTPQLSGGVFDAFAALYLEATGNEATDSPFVPESYDAMTVIIEALKRTATKDGDNLVIDLKKLNDEIRATDMVGTIGRISFDDKGDNAGGEVPVTLFQIVDGEYVQLD